MRGYQYNDNVSEYIQIKINCLSKLIEIVRSNIFPLEFPFNNNCLYRALIYSNNKCQRTRDFFLNKQICFKFVLFQYKGNN